MSPLTLNLPKYQAEPHWNPVPPYVTPVPYPERPVTSAAASSGLLYSHLDNATHSNPRGDQASFAADPTNISSIYASDRRNIHIPTQTSYQGQGPYTSTPGRRLIGRKKLSTNTYLSGFSLSDTYGSPALDNGPTRYSLPSVELTDTYTSDEAQLDEMVNKLNLVFPEGLSESGIKWYFCDVACKKLSFFRESEMLGYCLVEKQSHSS